MNHNSKFSLLEISSLGELHFLGFPFVPLFEKKGDLDQLLEENEKVEVYIYYKNDVPHSVVFMLENEPVRMIFLHAMRLSFQNKRPTEVVYDIECKENLSLCTATIYSREEGKVTFMQTSKSTISKTKETAIIHTIFPESYAKLSINIFRFKEGTIIESKDKFNQVPLEFSSWDYIEDPIRRFQKYLMQLEFPSFQIAQHIFLKKLYELSLEFSKREETFQIRVCNLACNSISSVFPLLTLKAYVLQQKHSEQEELFIERLLSEKTFTYAQCSIDFSEKLIKNLLNKKICYFVNLEQSDLRSILLSIEVNFEDTSSDLMRGLITHLFNSELQEKGLKNKIEVKVQAGTSQTKWQNYFDEILEFNPPLRSKLVENLERITFIVLEDDKFDYYTYFPVFSSASEVSFKEQSNLRHVHLSLLDNIEFHSYQKNHLKKSLYSDANSYIYHHEHQYSSDDPSKVDNLFGISLVPSSDTDLKNLGEEAFYEELDMCFINLITNTSKYLSEKKEEKTKFNHLLFDIINPIPFSREEIKAFTDSTICKHYQELMDNKIYSISFKQKSQLKNEESGSIFIKYQNNCGYYKEVINEDNVIEIRRRQALRAGSIFAYDIPDLLSHVAQTFNESLRQGQKKQCCDFVELDVDASTLVFHPETGLVDYNQGRLIEAIDSENNPRPYGQNQAGVVIGIHTIDLGVGFPIKRVLIIGDLTHSSKGAISAEECLRINLAIRYAYEHGLPIDWFTASFGVEIHKEHGVENLDASASTCREIVRYSQDYGVPINIVVSDVNIGAQSYWDAIAAMVQDTHSVLIMTPKGTMSLTGHLALTSALYSSLHSEDIPKYAKNLFPDGLQSLAGYQEIHGPNGEATLFAQNYNQACEFLLLHHYFTYSLHFSQMTSPRCNNFDPIERNILEFNYPLHEISIKEELDKILKGMKANRYGIIEALRDQGSPAPLHLWQDAKGIKQESLHKGCVSQTASTIVCEMLLGSRPVMLIFPPLGPLTPLDSEIIAKAINKASNHLPVVILGNLTGFNSDPLSMQNKQLTHGASIVRSIVHYQGVIVLVNLGYMVGGAYVVFSKQLNPCVKIIAVDGAKAQVVSGNIAAKIVFHSRIRKRVQQDPRMQQYNIHKNPDEVEKKQIDSLFRSIMHEIEGEEEKVFNLIHDVKRARKFGSIDAVISPKDLRKEIIRSIEEHLSKQQVQQFYPIAV